MNEGLLIIFTLAALIIVIGSLASYLFKKTGLPDMIFLIILGLIFGPFLGIIKREDVVGVAPIFAIIALITILLDGGISLDVREIFSHSPRAMLLAVLSFILSVSVVALFMHFILGLSLVHGILFGSIIGGSSSIAVISIIKKMDLGRTEKTLLSLESAITDILCTIVALTLIGLMISGQFESLLTLRQNFYSIIKEMASKFTTGAVIGGVIGLIWLGFLRRINKEPYAYMLTLAIVFLGYVFSESLGGSGALSALLFGIVVGNERYIARLLRREEEELAFDKGVKRTGSEVTFLIKTFFFVYLGLMVSVQSLKLIILGVMISILLLVVRYVSVFMATLGSAISQRRGVITYSFARGLAAAVLAIMVLEMELPNGELFVDLALVVIITTAIISTLGIFHYRERSMLR